MKLTFSLITSKLSDPMTECHSIILNKNRASTVKLNKSSANY